MQYSALCLLFAHHQVHLVHRRRKRKLLEWFVFWFFIFFVFCETKTELSVRSICLWILTRLHGLCSTTDDATAVGPLLIIACESCIGFIGGGSTTSSSFSASAEWACCCWSCSDFAWWSTVTFSRKRLMFVFCSGCSSSAVIVAANLKAFSEPFLRNGRSFGVADDDDGAAAVVLSTLPWDNFRSGGGNHFRLQLKLEKKKQKIDYHSKKRTKTILPWCNFFSRCNPLPMGIILNYLRHWRHWKQQTQHKHRHCSLHMIECAPATKLPDSINLITIKQMEAIELCTQICMKCKKSELKKHYCAP